MHPDARRPTVEVAVVRRGNTIKQLLSEYDPATRETSDMDLSSIDRMLLYVLDGSTVVHTIDSAVNADAITWTGNAVTLDIGDLVTSLDAGKYSARLTAIDAAGGQTELIHEDLPRSRLTLLIGAAEQVS